MKEKKNWQIKYFASSTKAPSMTDERICPLQPSDILSNRTDLYQKKLTKKCKNNLFRMEQG